MYCDDCVNLIVKEKDQTKAKEPHFCRVYKIEIKHNGQHPRLPRPTQCKVYLPELDIR